MICLFNQSDVLDREIVGKGSGAEAPIYALHMMLTAIGREDLMHHLSLDFVVKFVSQINLNWTSCWIGIDGEGHLLTLQLHRASSLGRTSHLQSV